MENPDNQTTVIPPVASDRRASRLVVGISNSDAFAGWGPRMESSIRNVLRGLN